MSEISSFLKNMSTLFYALSKGLETMSETIGDFTFPENVLKSDEGNQDKADNAQTEENVSSETEPADETLDEEQEIEEPKKNFRKKTKEPFTKFVYRIIQHYKEGISTSDLREITGLTPTQLSAVLVQLKKQEKVQKAGWGLYVLSDAENIEDESTPDEEEGTDDVPPKKKFRKKNKETNTKYIYRIISENENGISTKDLRDITGLNPTQINGVMGQLKKQGKVKSISYGMYVKADAENNENNSISEDESIPVDEMASESVATDNEPDKLDDETQS